MRKVFTLFCINYYNYLSALKLHAVPPDFAFTRLLTDILASVLKFSSKFREFFPLYEILHIKLSTHKIARHDLINVFLQEVSPFHFNED